MQGARLSKVVSLFPAAEQEGPHLSGTFVCGACQHEWQGVAPVGTTHCECPNCKRFWGAMKHVVEPQYAWRCNCGEQLFWLTPAGAMCRRCGVLSSDWAD